MADDALEALLKTQLAQVEACMRDCLGRTAIEHCVRDMCESVLASGGKRIRPRLTLLVSGLITAAAAPDPRCLRAAAAVELLHTATLIHDDVIDKAPLRRHRQTLNAAYGNHAAVLAGDYLSTRCFQVLHGINCPALYDLAFDTASALISGELYQLEHQGDLEVTVAGYEQTVFCKTGALFVCAVLAPALILQLDAARAEALRRYATALGIGFQVADDLLDYSAAPEQLGKAVGEDLADGRITLPLILALQHVDPAEKADLIRAAEQDDLPRVLHFIALTRARERCREYAEQSVARAREALRPFPPSPYKTALEQLSVQAVRRRR